MTCKIKLTITRIGVSGSKDLDHFVVTMFWTQQQLYMQAPLTYNVEEWNKNDSKTESYCWVETTWRDEIKIESRDMRHLCFLSHSTSSNSMHVRLFTDAKQQSKLVTWIYDGMDGVWALWNWKPVVFVGSYFLGPRDWLPLSLCSGWLRSP